MLSHWFERGLGQILAPDPNRPPLEGDGDDSDLAADGSAAGEGGDAAVRRHGGMWDGFWDRVAPRDVEFERSRHGSRHGGGEEVARRAGGVEAPLSPPSLLATAASALDSADAFAAKTAAASASASASASTLETPREGEVRCVHCRRPTPSSSESSSRGTTAPLRSPPPPRPPTAAASASAYRTPHSSKSGVGGGAFPGGAPFASPPPPGGPDAEEEEVEAMVLICARATAASMTSPTARWEIQKSVLNLCASERLPEKKRGKLRKKLAADPTLVWCRASGLGTSACDGWTPLHAAAGRGNLDAAKVLIEAALAGGRSGGGGGVSGGDGGGAESGGGGDGAEGGGTEESKEDGDGAAAAAPTPAPATGLERTTGRGRVGALLHARDLQGRTPLHVAAEAGRVDMVKFLKEAMGEYPRPPAGMLSPDGEGLMRRSIPGMAEMVARGLEAGRIPVGSDAPLDLTGRTPLGWAVVSREPSARERRRELEDELFSPDDASLCGDRTPAKDRTGGRSARRNRRSSSGELMSPGLMSPGLGPRRGAAAIPEDEEEEVVVFDRPLPYGVSERPGFRIDMEDALCAHYPLVPPSCAVPGSTPSSPAVSVGLFGVFDGHGDGGLVSEHLARRFASAVQSTEEWGTYLGGVDGLARATMRACANLDEEMRDEEFGASGGSTAVVALVTEETVIVANVGDCRCILVRRPEEEGRAAENEKEVPKLVQEEALAGAEEAIAGAQEAGGGGAGPSSAEGGEGETEAPAAGEASEPSGPPATTGPKGGSENAEEGSKEEPYPNEGRQEEGKPPETPSSAPPPPQSVASAAPEERGEGAESVAEPEPEAAAKERPAPSAPAVISVTALSEDHKPDLPAERERIEKAGLLVLPDVFRDPDVISDETEGAEDNIVTLWKVVKGDPDGANASKLAVSRAFGDFDYKDNGDLGPEEQAVVSAPDLRVHPRDGNRDLYLVLACDGVWDVMSNDEVGALVHAEVERRRRRERGSPRDDDDGTDGDLALAEAADELLEECLRRGSRDNMTAVIVSLGAAATSSSPSGGGGAVFPDRGGGGGARAKLFAEE